jgi:signal peptidase II
MTRVRGLIRPTPGVWATADTARSERRLINWQDQAILLADGSPLGECRLRMKKIEMHISCIWLSASLFFLFACQAIRVFIQNDSFNGKVIFETWIVTLNIQHAYNYGINFGLMAVNDRNGQVALGVTTILVSLFFAYYLFSHSEKKISFFASSLFIAGGVSNSVERIIEGHVFDYINTPVFGLSNPFSYNLADIMIFLAVFILMLGEKK